MGITTVVVDQMSRANVRLVGVSCLVCPNVETLEDVRRVPL